MSCKRRNVPVSQANADAHRRVVLQFMVKVVAGTNQAMMFSASAGVTG
jgi:hypothetical protein